MTKYQITNGENTKTYSSKHKAEEAAKAIPGDIDVEPVEEPTTDGGTEVVETSPESEPIADNAASGDNLPEDTEQALSKIGESLTTDPLEILPSHMIDDIKGKPAVNKRGYAMIAEFCNIGVTTELVELPWDNDEGRAVAKGTATTEDGREYTAYATACKGDGDMGDQLVELADTRCMKRSVALASGVGITAYQELSEELE